MISTKLSMWKRKKNDFFFKLYRQYQEHKMTTIKQLQKLPIHIRRMIYEYDPSSRMSFKVVLQELKTTSVKRIRNKRKMLELQAKTTEDEIHSLEMLMSRSRNKTIVDTNELQKIGEKILQLQHQRRNNVFTIIEFKKNNY